MTATRRRVTPWIDENLEPNGVMVFGSNKGGRHTRGAAALASRLGAVRGVASGLMGRTYGIPTKPHDVSKRLEVHEIGLYVDVFTEVARSRRDLRFYVTEIGCGLAWYDPREIAPLFEAASHLENVWLPARFWDVLLGGVS